MKELQKKQAELDKFIYNKQGIPLNDLKLKEKIIALDVELSEFANEIEFFKYWKVNKGKNKILEEACDCLHFILSIANALKVNLDEFVDIENIKNEKLFCYSVENIYIATKLYLLEDVLDCEGTYSREEATCIIFENLVMMILKIGFTYEDLIKEYDRKYEINIQRQKEGY